MTREEDDPQEDQSRHVQEGPEDDQDPEGVRTDPGERDDQVPDDQAGIAGGVLDGVAGLMRGDPQGGERAAGVDPLGEPEDLVSPGRNGRSTGRRPARWRLR